MAHPTHAELSGLLASDRQAFVAALGRHPWFEHTLVPFVTTLQADPELAAAVREQVPDYQLARFDQWLARRVLPLTRLERPAFCELATAVARERDPSFPALSAEPLPIVESWYCGCRRRNEARVDGRGWVFEVVEQDVGPAEAIHEEQWSADGHGDGWTVRVRLWSSSSDVRVWVEPDAGPCLL